MPVAVALSEYKALVKLATKHATRLIKLGVSREQLTEFTRLSRRLEALEKQWRKTRAGIHASKSTNKDIAEAEALKAKLLSAGRYAFRKDESALADLSAIAEGTGLADTIQDLSDLNDFWSERTDSLAKTKATQKDVDRAMQLFERLDDAAATESADTDSVEAHTERNRCFWAASDLADEIRAAGRYAFDDEPAVAAKYSSRYRARIARRARKKQQEKKSAKPAPGAASASA